MALDNTSLIPIALGGIAIGAAALKIIDKLVSGRNGNGKSRKSGEIAIAEWELFFTKMKDDIVNEVVKRIKD